MEAADEFNEYTIHNDAKALSSRKPITELMDGYNLVSPRPALVKALEDSAEGSEYDELYTEESLKEDYDETEQGNESTLYVKRLNSMEVYELEDCQPFEWCQEFDDVMNLTHKEIYRSKDGTPFVD